MQKIIFSKPNPAELNKQGYMCIDMHVHTEFSDGSAKIKQILKSTLKQNIGLAITDHTTISGYNHASALKNGSKIIPGIEVASKEGRELLFYFYNGEELNEFYKKEIGKYKQRPLRGWTKRSFIELLELSNEYNCLVSCAHPFAPAWKNITPLLRKGIASKIQNMEVINSQMRRGENIQALNFSEKNQTGITGGSDAHQLDEVGRVLTCSHAETIQEFLNNIQKKRNLVIGTSSTSRSLLADALSRDYFFIKHRLVSMKNRSVKNSH